MASAPPALRADGLVRRRERGVRPVRESRVVVAAVRAGPLPRGDDLVRLASLLQDLEAQVSKGEGEQAARVEEGLEPVRLRRAARVLGEGAGRGRAEAECISGGFRVHPWCTSSGSRLDLVWISGGSRVRLADASDSEQGQRGPLCANEAIGVKRERSSASSARGAMYAHS